VLLGAIIAVVYAALQPVAEIILEGVVFLFPNVASGPIALNEIEALVLSGELFAACVLVLSIAGSSPSHVRVFPPRISYVIAGFILAIGWFAAVFMRDLLLGTGAPAPVSWTAYFLLFLGLSQWARMAPVPAWFPGRGPA
jgi:hypothetical protein